MDSEYLLSNDALSRFLRDGYLVLQPPTLTPALHAQHFDAAARLYDEVRKIGSATAHLSHLGDNLLARIPSLFEVLNAPTVQGALERVLGPRPVLHPHHFVHSAGRADQGFHQDGNLPWNTRGHFRSQRPIAAMLFYYPQAVTDEMGPTEVLPGTQFWTGNFEDGDQWHADDSLDRAFNDEVSRADDLSFRDARLAASLRVLRQPNLERRRLTVPAGSVVIAHYDIVHRGTRQQPGWDGRRFMYKFYFLRVQEPRRTNTQVEPTLLPARPKALAAGAAVANEATVAHVWAWLHGDANRVANADTRRLREQLEHSDEATRRAAGIALAAEGDVDALLRAVTSPSVTVRRMAAFALGETRLFEAHSVDALVTCLNDVDELVRSNAAFALGSLARVNVLPHTAIDALLNRLNPACEPDNTQSAGLSRSTVRECIAQALLLAACNAGLNDAQCEQLAGQGLTDSSRYVRGLVVAALRRAGERTLPAWTNALLSDLDARTFNAVHTAND